MRHVVELKMPKLFGKKKDDIREEAAGVEETIVETIEEAKKTIVDTNDKFKETLKVAAPFVATLAVGYMLGYNRGLTKNIKNAGEKIIVIK